MQQRFRLASLAALLLSALFTNAVSAADVQLRIAMVQWRGETEACRGFKDAMKEMGYSVQYTVLNAEQDRTRLATLLREDLDPNLAGFDYVYSYGTTASKMTKTILRDRIPHVFSNVAAPVESQVVVSMEAPGGNLSGTSNRIPLSIQIKTARQVLDFKTVGIFFNPRENNAMVMRSTLYELGKQYGFSVIDFRSPPSKDMLDKNLDSLRADPSAVDAIYLPLDSFLMTKADVIGPELRSLKIKTIAAQKKYIENGALMGVIPDYYKLGRAVASIVDRHYKGEKLQNIPVAIPDEPLLMVNRTTANFVGANIPDALLTNAIVVD